MLLVEIEKPANKTLAAWFAELRDWLDAHQCTPSVFAHAGRRLDLLIYRVSFADAATVHQFCKNFAEYSPMVRRASPFERDQLSAIGAPELKLTADAAE